jgi:hypothetical protein
MFDLWSRHIGIAVAVLYERDCTRSRMRRMQMVGWKDASVFEKQ